MLINKTSVNRIKGSDVGILIQKFALSFVFFKTYSKIGKTAQIERERPRGLCTTLLTRLRVLTVHYVTP